MCSYLVWLKAVAVKQNFLFMCEHGWFLLRQSHSYRSPLLPITMYSYGT